MKRYTTEFTRKTPDGDLRLWGGGDIFAKDLTEANYILHKYIEPFLEEKLGDEVTNVEIGGESVYTISDNSLADKLQSESTKYLQRLDYWFYIPQLDRMMELGEINKPLIESMVSYFITYQEYEICDKLNEIRRTI